MLLMIAIIVGAFCTLLAPSLSAVVGSPTFNEDDSALGDVTSLHPSFSSDPDETKRKICSLLKSSEGSCDESEDEDMSHVVAALGSYSASPRVIVFGTFTSWFAIVSLLEFIRHAQIAVVSSCADTRNFIVHEHLVDEAGLNNRVELNCESDGYDPDYEFDAVVVDGRGNFTYSELLEKVVRGREWSKSAGLAILRGCDSSHDSWSFLSSQVWDHVESFGLVSVLRGSRLCLGHFSAKEVSRKGDGVNLLFKTPAHFDEYYDFPDFQNVAIDVKVSQGSVGSLVRVSPHSWRLCYTASPTAPAISEMLRPHTQPVCRPLLATKLPRIDLKSRCGPGEFPRQCTFSSWLEGAEESAEGLASLSETKPGFTSIHVTYGAQKISRAQAFGKRFDSQGFRRAPTTSAGRSPSGLGEAHARSRESTAQVAIDAAGAASGLGRNISSLRRWGFMCSCSRGTGMATFNYAHHMEALLRQVSALILCVPPHDDEHLQVLMRERFGAERVVSLSGWPAPSELDPLLLTHRITDLYMLKAGPQDGVLSLLPSVRNCVHCVFTALEPHGDVYAKISAAVGGGSAPTVPFMVDMPKGAGDLRTELGIPRNATVFGRYGGRDTFDVPFAHSAVREVSQRSKDVYFVFMNTPTFCCEDHPNVLFLPPTANVTARAQFVETCDAMLHARSLGETFGSAVAEFSALNKPVLTFGGAHDQSHLEVLEEAALLYHDSESLRNLLLRFNRTAAAGREWNRYQRFAPASVMKTFRDVFG